MLLNQNVKSRGNEASRFLCCACVVRGMIHYFPNI
jgi:hypothetical protein